MGKKPDNVTLYELGEFNDHTHQHEFCISVIQLCTYEQEPLYHCLLDFLEHNLMITLRINSTNIVRLLGGKPPTTP